MVSETYLKVQACRFRLYHSTNFQSGIAILSEFDNLNSIFRVLVLSDTGNQYQNLQPSELESLSLLDGTDSRIDLNADQQVKCGWGNLFHRK